MLESILDEYMRKITPVYRKLNDFKIKTFGSKIDALILKIDDINSLGDEENSIKSTKEITCFITYPGEVTIFRSRDSNGNLQEDNAIYLEDILPIELFVPLDNQEITVEENDIIIHLLWDEQENCIPQVFKTLRSLGNFNIKELVTKKFILSNIRDTLNSKILLEIKQYVEKKVEYRLNLSN